MRAEGLLIREDSQGLACGRRTQLHKEVVRPRSGSACDGAEQRAEQNGCTREKQPSAVK